MGSRKTWLATAGVFAALLGLFANGSSAAKGPNHTAPVETALPSISGTPLVGTSLTGSAGSWTGSGIRESYQWLRCDSTGATCASISGATSMSEPLTTSDLRSTLRFSVIAFNRYGSTSATSAPTAVVGSATTGGSGGTSAPATPTGLSASNPTTSGLTLSWSASSGSDPATGYDVYLNGTKVAATPQTSYAAGGLSCGTSYTFSVDAYDAAGNTSPTVSTTASTSACASSNQIYWGAYMDGNDTYDYLYGGSWGDAPWDTNTWHKFESNAGKKVSIVHWGLTPPWKSTFSSYQSTFNLVQNAGDLNAVDMSTGSVPLAAIAAGQYDASITTWFQQAAAWGHPFFLILDVEMNGTWEPYSPGNNGNTAADFVAAWRHMHDLAVAAGATNVTWVWAPNVDPTGKFTPYSQLYPGDTYVDWTGLDGYNKTGTQSFGWLYGPSYKALLQMAPDKPIMVTQVGSVEGGIGKAAWITDALETQLPTNFPQIKAFLWFNWRIYENGAWQPWEIESSASSQQAFANGISSSYYAPGGSFGQLPLLSKITPLLVR